MIDPSEEGHEQPYPCSATRPVPSPPARFSFSPHFGRYFWLSVVIYFVGAEQGATSLISAHYLHEFLHDGRHIMAFLCALKGGCVVSGFSCAVCSPDSSRDACGCFASVAGEPSIERAIAFESAADAAPGQRLRRKS